MTVYSYNPYMVVKFNQTRGEYLSCPSCKAEVAKVVIEEAAG